MAFIEYYRIDMQRSPHDYVTVVVCSEHWGDVETDTYYDLSSKYANRKLIYVYNDIFLISKNEESNEGIVCVKDVVKVWWNSQNKGKLIYIFKNSNRVKYAPLESLLTCNDMVQWVDGNHITIFDNE